MGLLHVFVVEFRLLSDDAVQFSFRISDPTYVDRLTAFFEGSTVWAVSSNIEELSETAKPSLVKTLPTCIHVGVSKHLMLSPLRPPPQVTNLRGVKSTSKC